MNSANIVTPVSVDNTLSGNGFPDTPIGVIPTAYTSTLWSGSTGTLFTAALSQPYTNFDFLDLYGYGTASGPGYIRVNVVPGGTMTTTVHCVTPWLSNYSICAGQRISFPSTTSFSAGSAFYFGMTNGGTGYVAANRVNAAMDCLIYRIDGVKYNTGEQ